MKNQLFQSILENPLNAFLPLAVIAIILNVSNAASLTILLVSAIAMIPMAGLIGEATESIAASLGPRLSGLMNVTFGN
jgi:Ca2+:H+ antiporter